MRNVYGNSQVIEFIMLKKLLQLIFSGNTYEQEVPFDWIICKNDKPIARLYEAKMKDMYWKEALIESVDIDLNFPVEDQFWDDKNIVLKHNQLEFNLKDFIIRSSEKKDRVLIRGVLDKMSKLEFPNKRDNPIFKSDNS